MSLRAAMTALLIVVCLLPPQRMAVAASAMPRVVQEGALAVHLDGVDEPDWQDLSAMIKDQLSLSGNQAPNEPLADDLAFFTRQHYIRKGWPEAQVRWELCQDGIHLRIDAGERIRVGEIGWKGDLILPEEELRKFLLRPTVEKDDASKKDPIWVRSDLEGGAALVARRLRAEGYLQAKAVLVPAAEVHDHHRDLTVEVTPGPRFLFGSVRLDGAPAELEQRMQAEIQQTKDSPFNEASVQDLQRRLTDIAFSHGYIQAATAAEYHLGTRGGTVDVSLVMQPGPRARIARVTPHPGFSRGSQRVLNANFKPALGEFYSADEVDFMFRRSLDTGMFARLDESIKPLPGPPGEPQAELRLSGEEARPKTLGFELGFDTFLGPQVGVSFRNTNFRDAGNTLAAELNWSAGGPLGFVQLTDPAVFNSPYAASVRLGVENFSRFEYSRYGTSVNLELARRVTENFSFTGFIGVALNTVSTDVLTVAQTGPDLYTLTTAGFSMMLDFRDSPVLPKRGWFLSTRVESTLDVAGSNVNFISTDLRGAWYQPLTRKLRFAAGAGLMSIQGVDVVDLPIDSRVFNGGPNSVRAFNQRELGPVTPGGTPLGGTSAIFASAELSYEVFRNLEFAVFGDIGSLGRGNNATPFDYSTDFRPAIGAGLRYHLPFGPIRIDYGHNVNKRTGEGSGFLHVTVGFAF